MGKVKDELLFTLLKNYLTVYLPERRKASPNTIITYRTVWNKLLDYAAEKKKKRFFAVTLADIDKDTVLSFLDSTPSGKKMSDSTFNNRLAAIKAFLAYASACSPEYIIRFNEIGAIKSRKVDLFRGVDYMSEAAVKALLNVPNPKNPTGLRDQFFMILLYDTGSRIQEILGIHICDIKLGNTPTVMLCGKGRKNRIVPIMKDTVKHLQNYLQAFHPDENEYSKELLFYSVRRGIRLPLCDDTMRIRLQKYADIARKECNEVPEKVYPHLWRHTRAMHLYQNGMDLSLISQWLGHEQLTTTLVYAHADTEAKRLAIEKAMAVKDVTSNINTERYVVDDEETIKKLYGL